LSNQLLAIRDMGLVAAVTITGAMFADLLLLPALYIFLTRKRISAREGESLSADVAD
jgi:predicted RND superfamily exporter protein